jgi:hypothetical protein
VAERNETLISLLRPLGRRLRLRDGHLLATRTLWLPLLAAALIQLLGRLFPLLGYDRLAWTPLALWLVLVLGYGLLRPLPPFRVARRADAELGLRDRLATALELGHGDPERSRRFDAALVASQQSDALAVARSLDLSRAFPLRWPTRLLALAAGCLAAALLLTYLPNPMDAILTERAAVAAAAEEQAEQLEELAEELAADETLDPAEREELLRQLREAIESLRNNPGDREQAMADLAKLEEALRHQLDPESAARRTALEGLAADLSALAAPISPPSVPPLGGAEGGDEAARLLQELAEQAAEMSPAERENLADALAEAAARIAGSDAALASALSQLAQGVRSGQSFSQAAQSAADALRAASADASLQQALAQALGQAQGAANALAQVGQSGQAQTPGQGQGQSPGQGPLGGGGGTTARTGPPGVRPGRAGDPTAPNKSFDVDELDTVFAPWQQGQPGDPDFLPGRQTDQGQETTRETTQPQPGASGAALVPYSEVFASYADAAVETMEREYVPSGLKEYVREYFTHLEP